MNAQRCAAASRARRASTVAGGSGEIAKMLLSWRHGLARGAACRTRRDAPGRGRGRCSGRSRPSGDMEPQVPSRHGCISAAVLEGARARRRPLIRDLNLDIIRCTQSIWPHQLRPRQHRLPLAFCLAGARVGWRPRGAGPPRESGQSASGSP
ncbi:hypothetical protein T492DRAFT_1055113 [Pavlovales sp. CCMP2436]|nr:hypothetical protein T492DRAFT_1055113 [Pavlovales sp. CCMP2436]